MFGLANFGKIENAADKMARSKHRIVKKINESLETTKNSICDHTNEMLYETIYNIIKTLSESTNHTKGKIIESQDIIILELKAEHESLIHRAEFQINNG
jgi:histone H3/H4